MRAIVMLAPVPFIYGALQISLGTITPSAVVTFANTYGPVYSMLTLAFLAYAAVRALPEAIWTAFFWVPLQSAVFFCFGSLVYTWGSDVTQLARFGHPLTIGEIALLRANTLIAVALPLVLSGMALILFWLPPPRVKPGAWTGNHRHFDPQQLAAVAFLVIAMGAGFKYLLVLPATWSQLQIVIPGTLTSLGFLTDLGFALLAYVTTLKGGRVYVLPLAIMWPVHVFLSLLAFAKEDIVVAMIFPILALYLGRRRMKELVVGGLAVALVFYAITPIVTHGRLQLLTVYGSLNFGGYAERTTALFSYFTAPDVVSMQAVPENEVQRWWIRLDYASPIAHGMALYDSGYPANTIETVWMRFIPRALWPEKPILTGPGAQFYSLILGRETDTLVGLSIYGDMYWHYGWTGVVIISFIVGILFALLGRLALRYVLERNFIFFPLVLFMILMVADGPAKYLINGVLGNLPILLAYIIVFSTGAHVLRTMDGPRAPPRGLGDGLHLGVPAGQGDRHAEHRKF